MLIPSEVKAPATSSEDVRIGHWLSEVAPDSGQGSIDVALLGFPSEEGVRRNGGRVGTAKAPELLRKALYKLTPDPMHYEEWQQLMSRTQDLGNVQLTNHVEDDQQLLAKIVGGCILNNTIPVILGGGHETAFGHFLGYVEAGQSVQIVNIDAHADVRPLKKGLAHSGSPFYQALEHESRLCKRYDVLGLAPWSVSSSHIQYLEQHNCTYHFADQITEAFLEEYFAGLTAPTMVTLDMDVVHQQGAPGVSAPAAGGIPVARLYQAAYLAGRSPWVRSLDLVEINPRFDIDSQTIRAGALTLWHFFKGLIERKESSR